MGFRRANHIQIIGGYPADQAASGELAPLVVLQFSMRVISIGPNQLTTASTRLLKEGYNPTLPSKSTVLAPIV